MARAAFPTRTWPTLLVWMLHLACIGAAVTFAALFVLMATSLDPMEIVTAGAEPWTNALGWSLAAAGLVLVAALGLRLWHSRRLRVIGATLLVLEIGATTWAGWTIYVGYF